MSLSGGPVSGGIIEARKTHVFLDPNETVVIEPGWSIERRADQLATVTPKNRSNLELFAGIGLRMSTHLNKGMQWTEHVAGAAAQLTAADVVKAPNITVKKMSSRPNTTNFPGILAAGTYDNWEEHSLTMFQKDVPATEDWDDDNSHLPDDETAFPGPSDYDTLNQMDRVLVTINNDNHNRDIYVKLYIPGSVQSSPAAVANIYFSGAASDKRGFTGDGRYCLTLCGDGTARLYERTAGAATWHFHGAHTWEPNGAIGNRFHLIRIAKVAYSVPGMSASGIFQFSYFNADVVGMLGNAFPSLNSALSGQAHRSTFENVFQVSNETNANPQPVSGPVRFDIRRDLRCMFGVGYGDFSSPAYVLDDPFSMGFWLRDTTKPIKLDVLWAAGAVSASINTQMWAVAPDGTETELTRTVQTSTHAEFTPIAFRSHYRVKITFTATEGAPLFMSYRVSRDGVISTTTGANVEVPIIRSMSVQGPARDLSLENAVFNVADPTGAVDILSKRASIPVRIETEYDPLDSAKRCVLFNGYMEHAEAERKGTKSDGGFNPNADVAVYPADDWKEYVCHCRGKFLRLQEALTLVQQRFFDVESYVNGTSLPSKVVDVIRSLLGYCGFQTADIDFPDLDIRLWNYDGSKHSILEAGMPIGDYIQELITTYLGHFLIYDGNVAKWRLIAPSVSPYVNVCKFNTDHPTPAGPTTNRLLRYDNYLKEEGDPINVFIKKHTFHSWVKKPEFNFLRVTAFGEISPGMLNTIADIHVFNPKSVNFGRAASVDTEDPDYLGRVVPAFYGLPGLGTLPKNQAFRAASWVARRLYDLGAHGVKMVSFEAPLVLIPHEQDATKMRPLRYYDPVLVNDSQFLVRSCNPLYKKDHVQMALYELEAPRF